MSAETFEGLQLKEKDNTWNPWTKTTIFKTRPLCRELTPDNLSIALDPTSESGLTLFFWSARLKYEFPLVERNGAFTVRSTSMIGIRDGSPNICRSWMDLLLIYKEAMQVQMSMQMKIDQQTRNIIEWPTLIWAILRLWSSARIAAVWAGCRKHNENFHWTLPMLCHNKRRKKHNNIM